MRKVWVITLTEWQYTLRDRVALLVLLLLPILFTTGLSLIFGGSGNTALRLGLVGSEGASRWQTELAERGARVEQLDPNTHQGTQERFDAIIKLPTDTSGRPVVEADLGTERGYRAYALILSVQAALDGTESAARILSQEAPGAALPSVTSSEIRAVQVIRSWKPVAEGVLQVSPGMLVMFVLMSAAYSGEGMVYERLNGTLRRMRAAPVSGWQYLLGRLLGKSTIGFVQLLLLAGFGHLFFNVDWGKAPALLLLTGLIFAVCTGAFGLLLGVISRTPEQLSSVATLSCLSLAAIGGAWWPIEAAPVLLQTIGRILPTGLAMKGFLGLIMSGSDWMDAVHTAWIGLLLWTFLFLTGGVFAFHFSSRRTRHIQHSPAQQGG
jgi:ABC-2 type transport system permease protein